MAANNITRAEARERAELLEVQHYDVALDLTVGDVVFGSTTTVRFDCRQPGASTFVELVATTVQSIALNGRSLDADVVFDGIRIRLDDLAASNELVVVAECAYSRTGEGLHRFVDPVDKETYLYSQFEPADAKRAFACFDQPDLKATFAFTVTAPSYWQVVSNEPAAEPEQLALGNARWRFATTPRISSYITAIVGGPYHVVRDEWQRPSGGVVPLGVYCRASLGQYLDQDEVLEVTKQGLAFFEDRFGRPFPFTKYDQLFVPEFNAGAMENAGCVTFHEDYVVFRSKVTDAAREWRANTILHEMAHMWFGDLVTMRWWDDLWLNESFAEFMAYHAAANATRFRDSWTSFATGRKAWGYGQDQLPSTHPIAADAPDLDTAKLNFDGISYAKGASVLKQLVAWVGLQEFLAGVRTYFHKHAWGNTTLADLLAELESTSGRDLSLWSKEWLSSAGCNTLRPRFTVAADGSYAEFVVAQEAPEQHPVLRRHRIGIGLYDLTSTGLSLRDRVELDVVGAATDVPQLVGIRQPDLLLLNDGDLSFAKIRLDDRSLATATASIAQLDLSLSRALLWSAAWDMTRDAEMRGRDFVVLVANAVGRETEITTVQTALRQARFTIDRYVDPDHAPELRRWFAEQLHELVLAAEPGSDSQLAFVRSLAAVATEPAQLDLLAGLLTGAVEVPGLTVDAELRWSLLHHLVATGSWAPGSIEDELDRDRTANGERRAASARAAIPTPMAKEAAWSSLVDSDELPNALQYATILGFSDTLDTALLAPFVDRYFDAVGRLWDERTAEMAANLVVGLYPSQLVGAELVDRTNAYLAKEQPPAPLARLLAEGRDGVERALRCRLRDTRG